MSEPMGPGDIVRLRSGGPLMTVKSSIGGGVVDCVWFNKGKAKSQTFIKDTLILDRAKDVDVLSEDLAVSSVLSDSPLILLSSLVEAHEDGDDQNWWDHNYRHLCEVVKKQQ